MIGTRNIHGVYLRFIIAWMVAVPGHCFGQAPSVGSADTALSRKWNFRNEEHRSYPDGILVTGANSFIGSHVVHILLEKFPGPVHLLLRAPSEHDAVLKMQGSFRQWDLGEFDPEQVGQVIHLAMTPMYHLPYEHFRRIWIPELERMIAFCGDHQAHSIWLILDIFLRTGYFFPFTFRIIPVDILADVIVFNVLKERERAGQSFNRPMLDEPVTDRLFSRTASNLLGLKEANLVAVREACLNKLRPSAAMVFMSNLNALLARKNETVTI